MLEEAPNDDCHTCLRLERIEALAVQDPPTPEKLRHWKEIWGRCTLLEKRFWDMAMDLS
jgi:hydroxymethylpyrimidine/phosphomethylpyrimidine kinase